MGAIDKLEAGNPGARLDAAKALRIAQTYHAFICSNINNSIEWTLENGYRTIIASLGISLDGTWRNKIGDLAEEQIRSLILEWMLDHQLVASPAISKEDLKGRLSGTYELTRTGMTMIFSSEPDIAFVENERYLAVVEIKGGTDDAGALERYGAAQKSFQHAIKSNPHCQNFYIAAALTPEVENRIADDRLVSKTFDLVEIVSDARKREQFMLELFRYALRLV